MFRAGDYGERGCWTTDDLDRLAATYDPRKQAAPVVVGHPADDAPAYGWVKRLRRAGESLWAQLEKVDPALETLLRAGRLAQRSVALYKRFPLTDGPYLRHVGFLGAAPPAVKGLAPVRLAFAEGEFFRIDTGCRPIAAKATRGDQAPAAGALRLRSLRLRSGQAGQAAGLNGKMKQLGDNTMSETKSKLESFVDHLRRFFLPDPPTATPPGEGSAEPSPAPSSAEAAFAERLAALEQKLEAAASARASAQQKLAEAEADKSRAQIAGFVEGLRSQGRFPPMYERWGVVEFMERLAEAQAVDNAADKNVCPTGNNSAEAAGTCDRESESLLVWFQEFLSRLPAVIEFREIGGASVGHRTLPAGNRSSVVRFTEPARGMSVDPASVELAERAEALAAEENISYAEALAHLREQRRSPTSA